MMIFMTFDISEFFENVVKIKVSVHSNKNNGYFTYDRCTFMIKPRSILLGMRNISDKNCRENLNTHFMFSIPPPISYRLWDEEIYGEYREVTDNSIIQRRRIAFWITKVTDTHSEYVILIAYSRQQWLREEASILLLYVHCLSCCLLKSVVTALGTA